MNLLKPAFFFLILAVVSGALVFSFYCPCERTPGGYLLGPEVEAPVTDWNFVNDVGLCQIEVRGLLPHSVNLNCMAAAGDLYLSCARCDGKRWSSYALSNPVARLRIDGNVYPVELRKVTQAHELDRAWMARAAKTGREAGLRQAGWWSFGVTSMARPQ